MMAALTLSCKRLQQNSYLNCLYFKYIIFLTRGLNLAFGLPVCFIIEELKHGIPANQKCSDGRI